VQVFYRERASLMYDPLATGLSVLISELPYLGTQSVIFTIIVFFMVGFVLTAEKFFFFMLMVSGRVPIMGRAADGQ
jgi:ABC-type multidrug transport system permease subunit